VEGAKALVRAVAKWLEVAPEGKREAGRGGVDSPEAVKAQAGGVTVAEGLMVVVEERVSVASTAAEGRVWDAEGSAAAAAMARVTAEVATVASVASAVEAGATGREGTTVRP
jgi:hypothetical protein